ncbi:type IV secretory system conjugative DNA transfer family protein [Pectobacterium brasiliense]|uniref:Type IV secretory system conjugative DNA transfer family protein n=1 Tax=Pectobacterium brasiliense TaxID=180957 RepID=A0A3S5K206_9GAMM|nr:MULTISPECIES: type IV secretory system conjugative DNA transfer family protein [Pectobacterium]GKW26943.1 molybdopterin-guanine dinucleotide biosynthesis protein MobB [Pectobacterium carotovorum subsp. carotovorum]MBN3047780.1 type IV secretory system conjugative DNA transfer family protein [Pectobacterium brasiliense]MBN3076734.1 type IV secretory system conjugative DNA transfer family protein [Pectobacterium brasiliense]MBN3084210.1 type IV secretory system conjugative DNA transfer family 
MILNKLAVSLSPIVNGVLSFIDVMQQHQLMLALLSGLALPFFASMKSDDRQKAPLWKKLIITFSLLCFLFGTVGPLLISVFRWLYNDRILTRTPILDWSILIIFTVAGLILHISLRRVLTPELDNIKKQLIKKTRLERELRTDVRTVKSLLPETLHYNPLDYINLNKGIFIGIDRDEKPMYLPLKDWQRQHADIIGTTGAGKGVATGILLYQSILAGEGVFIMDPKDDEWATHLYRKACEDAGKPFALIDLRKPQYQLNLIENITPDELEELFVAGFSLAEKGQESDFYRIDDRKAARMAAQFVSSHPSSTIRDIYNGEYVQGIAEDIKAFFGKIEELALLNAINAPTGFSLQSVFDEGGCCYVIGSMRNSKIITAQRMLLVRLYQLAERRDRVKETPRPIAIFLDELKYHLSKPALEGLGAARDKGVHIIMAHQSIADLKDCPADLKGDAVVGAVVENAKFKLVYRVMDPDTAEWVARMSGTILVDDEIRKAKTDAVLTETIDGERTIRQAERFFIDSNMILNLPDFVSFIFTTRTLPSASLISPIKVQKHELEIYSVSPDIAASAAPAKIALDFDEEGATSASTTNVAATHPDLFFEGESKSAKPRSDDDETPSLLNF